MEKTAWKRSLSAIAQVVLCLALMTATAEAATLYVATTGSTTASYGAMQNINTPGRYDRAMSLALAGDTIVLKPGIYTATNLGSTGSVGVMGFYRSNQIVRAQYSATDPSVPVANRSVIKIYDPNVYTPGVDAFYTAIIVENRNDITIEGFEIDGRFPANFNGDTAGRWPNGISIQSGAARITVNGNIIHDVWGGGVATSPRRNPITNDVDNPNVNACDYITITRNVVYNCCYWSRSDASGISLLHTKLRPMGDTSIHNYIAYNRVYGNESRYTGLSRFGRGHTDGNGIIIDSFEPDSPYTLIENNLCYDNGARGIHVFRSDNVTARNNTMYKNCQDPAVQDAEFVGVGQNILYTNNIAYGTGNTPIYAIRNDEGNVPSSVTVSYNLYFSFQSPVTYGNWDQYGDPLFFNTTAGDFRCGYNSLAVNSGNTANFAPFDFAGSSRPLGTRVDRGAHER